MANDQNTATASQDVVGVFDSNFNQIFEEARAIKATVKEEAKVMEHPLEDGSTITDHKIILPTEIELSLIIQAEDYKSVYDKIKEFYLGTELLSVQTRTGEYSSMVIQAMPHDETADMFDTVAIAMRLKEVKLVQAQFGGLPPRKVADPNNASTVKKGEQQAQGTTEERKGSVLSRIFG